MKSDSLFSRTVAAILIPAVLATSGPVFFFSSASRGLAQAPTALRAPVGNNWQPPAKPAPQARQKALKRGAPQASGGVSVPDLAAAASDQEICQCATFAEPLVPMDGASTPAETAALAQAINHFKNRPVPEDLTSLLDFVKTHPSSRWNSALLLNAGICHYHTGWFSKALDSWWLAWQAGKGGTSTSQVQIADRALAEYTLMCARIGRKAELGTLLDTVAKLRNFQGAAALKIERAKEGFWTMCNKPEVAFCCGPYALGAIEPLLKNRPASIDFLQKQQSPDTGFSLTEVQSMSEKLGIGLQMAKRLPGSAMVFPSVVHWKVGHFGALVEEADGLYLLKDPTFGNETWLSKACIDSESSGFLLIPAGPLPEGWTAATPAEAKSIYGRGHSGNGGEGEGDDDGPKTCEGDSAGMATYSFHILLASLSISDKPVGYSPAYGPDMQTLVRFNQREYNQPSTLNFTNFGPQWVSNWVSYLEDNPASASATINLYRRGGGYETHTGYDAATQSFDLTTRSRVTLVRTAPSTYERRFSDGSKEIYARFIGTTGPKRRVFLSQVVDPQGNAITFEYDADPAFPSRIKKIFDATGLFTEFFYEEAAQPQQVTKIEDPFGRSAIFTYEDTAAGRRLTKIRDVQGIVSSFGYNAEGNITSLTTPYGTTTFALSPFKLGGAYTLHRFIEATDPQGDKERLEYNHDEARTGVPNTIREPLPDRSLIDYATGDHDDRITFYWDKKAMHQIGKVVNDPSDYRQAKWYRWVQPDFADRATSILEDTKSPLEGRVWYNYPGQPAPYVKGTHNRPDVVGRLVEDKDGKRVTQIWKYGYNGLANVSSMTDPAGRETVTEYEANGIDIKSVKQKRGADMDTLMSVAYDPADPPHLPRSLTDGAGKTTTMGYRTTGQVSSVKNARNETTSFEFQLDSAVNGFGRVKRIYGDVPGGGFTMTYDDFDRVRTVTESEGHSLTYDYDNLDRVTAVTYPDSSYEQFVYENKSLIARRDREGLWTRMFHNSIQEVTGVLDPLGRLTQFDWCRCGDISRLVDGKGNVTRWLHDVQGRATHKYYPDGTSECYTFDYSGRVKTYANRKTQVTTYSYHPDDTVQKIDYQDPATPDVSYTYDPDFNRPATRLDGIGIWNFKYFPYNGTTLGAGMLHYEDGPFPDDTQLYSYDELGRIKSRKIVDDATRAVASREETYDYDNLHRISRLSCNLGAFDYLYVGTTNRLDKLNYPNGQVADYDYFDNGGDQLLKTIHNLAKDGSTISKFDYTYTSDRLIKTWAQNLGATIGTSTYHFGYDKANQLISAVLRQDNTGPVKKTYDYGYDPAANRTSEVIDGTPTNYSVNELNQLRSRRDDGPTLVSGTTSEASTVTVNGQSAEVYEDGGGFRFRKSVNLRPGSNPLAIQAKDGNGNTTTQNYTVNATGPNQFFEYDLNGNLTTVKDAAGNIIRTYGWDQKNRLISIKEGAKVTTMAYDGMDRRIRIKDMDGTTVVNDNVFLWFGTEMAQKRHTGSEGQAQFSYFGYGELRGAVKFFITRDHLLSVMELIAEDGNSIMSRNSYDPIGNHRFIEGLSSDRLYNGSFYHSPSNLTLTIYRAYSAAIGIWLSPDPIGEVGGMNLYSFSERNPVNFADFIGLDAININYTGYEVNTGLGFTLPLGHAGVVTVDPKTGQTSYHEYGRYDAAKFGEVRRRPVPDVKMGPDGKPTAASLDALYDFLSKNYGKGAPVDPTYFADADAQKVKDYLEDLMNNPNRDPYGLIGNNCKTVANDAIQAGRK